MRPVLPPVWKSDRPEVVPSYFRPGYVKPAAIGYMPDRETVVNNEMGFFKKLIGGVKDVAKGVVSVVVAPVNSITGHQYNPKFETKVGGFVGGAAKMGVDNLHTVGKTFADTITGGLASKAVNVVRSNDKKESWGNYAETKNNKTGIQSLDKIRSITDKASVAFGAVAGAGALASGASKLVKASGVIGSVSSGLVPVGSGPVAVAVADDNANGSLPAWLIPVAVVGVLLMFGKKLF